MPLVVVVVVVVVVGVVGALVVEVVVDVGGAVVVDTVVTVVGVVVVVPSPPSSEAITASATTRPITAATNRAIAHFTPRLMPPVGGDPPAGGGPG